MCNGQFCKRLLKLKKTEINRYFMLSFKVILGRMDKEVYTNKFQTDRSTEKYVKIYLVSKFAWGFVNILTCR